MDWIERYSLEIAWVFLSISIFSLLFVIHRYITEHSVMNTIRKRYKENAEHKLENELFFVSKYGNIENRSFVYRFDRLILTSGIRKYLPWITGEGYLCVMFLSAMGAFVAGTVIFRNMYGALFCGIASAVGFYVFILALSSMTYNHIEDGTSVFVSLLCNHAKGSSDIVSIMQEAYFSLQEPLRHIVAQFLLDAEHTGNVDAAFDYMKESVDNRQLQTIIINLKSCMHYQANYEEVLTQMMGQIAAGLSSREERKNILFSMKITLVGISLASVVIVLVIGSGLGIDMKEMLLGNGVGQFLLFITGLLYLFVIVKLCVTDQ